MDLSVVLVAVSLIIILIVCISITYTLYKSPPPTGRTYLKCAPGMCPTNIYNGEKRCPVDSEQQLPYDASFEVCNSKTTCESRVTPYALLPDGSTNELGVCQGGETCRCLKTGQCSKETMALFKSISPGTARHTFAQIPIDAQGLNYTPLTYDDPNIYHCAIKAYHLNRIAPGACTFNIPTDPTLLEIRQCMTANPCLVGVLAFKPEDITKFKLSEQDLSAIYTIPVACVQGIRAASGNECDPISLPVWDRTQNKVTCYKVGV